MKPLIYPFTFEEWLKHPSTKPKIKWCKEVAKKMQKEEKYGRQTSLEL